MTLGGLENSSEITEHRFVEIVRVRPEMVYTPVFTRSPDRPYPPSGSQGEELVEPFELWWFVVKILGRWK